MNRKLTIMVSSYQCPSQQKESNRCISRALEGPVQYISY
jgi:hypothetical protein